MNVLISAWGDDLQLSNTLCIFLFVYLIAMLNLSKIIWLIKIVTWAQIISKFPLNLRIGPSGYLQIATPGLQRMFMRNLYFVYSVTIALRKNLANGHYVTRAGDAGTSDDCGMQLDPHPATVFA